jgi:threonine/homoserine/homoserine lactone efflux protein
MTIDSLIAFNIALLAALITPGPALLVAVQAAVGKGRRAGAGTGIGLALMAATWTAAALLGLDVIFRLFPSVYVVARAAGAVYLLYLAVQIWRSARKDVEPFALDARRAFMRGITVNFLNPKSVLFAAAVLVVVFPHDLGLAGCALVVVNHFVVELMFYMAVAVCAGSASIGDRFVQAKVVFNRGAAVVLGALGVRLLTSR